MNKIFCLAALATMALTSCVSINSKSLNKDLDTPVTTETRKIGNFTKIESSTGIIVEYTFGKASSTATVEGPEWILPYLVTETKNGELEVRLSKKYFEDHKSMNSKITVKVSSADIEEFDASSGSAITAMNKLKPSGDFEADASSGATIAFELGIDSNGKIECDASSGATIDGSLINVAMVEVDASSGSTVELSAISARKIEADAQSAATINLDGNADYAELEASSASSIHAKDLSVNKADVKASSAASVNYNAKQSNVSKSSGGSVKNHN